MNKKYNDFINWTKINNWDISLKENPGLGLNNSITTRYKDIPQGYKDFLYNVKHCIAPSEKSWFLCEDEYNDNSDIAFRWNEFELLSLEAATNDNIWESEIISWWDKHFPIFMSVDGAYSFYAIDLANNIGSIVQGVEPEFEEVEEIASSINDFFELIIKGKIQL